MLFARQLAGFVLVTLTLVAAGCGRSRPADEGGGGSAGDPAAGSTSSRMLSPTEWKIVGTWSESHIERHVRIDMKTTYKSDGTYTSTGVLKADVGQENIEVSGTWSVEGDSFIVGVEKSNYPLLFPAGAKVAVKLVSVSDANLITEDPATGVRTVETRVR